MFNIPDNLQKYKNKSDGGNKNGKPVKTFINNPNNLKNPSDLKTFCTAVNGKGDFTTYCYDYNDVHSSPNFDSPYKIKLIYSDLPH